MASIKDIRSQYPEYDDMSDEAFAKAFHRKFYSDLDYEDFAKRVGMVEQMAPTGTDIVETFEDGGRIVKSKDTGRETYMSDGYATSDPARIAEIRAAGGKAGEVYKKGFAQDIIGQLGEIPSRAASAIKGVPFVGSYIDEIIGSVYGPQAAQATRAAQEARETVAPVATGLSRAGVGLATAVPAALAAPAAAITPLGTSIGSRLAAGAGLGAVGGGLEGLIYGAGEGRTREERKASAESGAKLGAALGGGLGVLGPAVGGAIGAIRGRSVAAPARAIGAELETKGQALDLLSRAAGMDAPVAKEAMERAGQYASLGQMGPATRNLLDLAASSTSEGAAIARQNIEEVAGLAGKQFNDLLDNSFGGAQAAQAIEDALMQSTSGQRRELYDLAYEQAIDYSEPMARKLEELINRVDASIIKNAETLMKREGQPSAQIMAKIDEAGNAVFETLPDVRQIDYITRALNNVSPTAAPEDKNTARALASQIRQTLDSLVPEYASARELAGDVISIRDALDIGTKAFAPSFKRYDLKKAMDGMTGAEIGALKQGVRSYIDDIMASAKASLTDPNQDAREMVRPIKDMLSRAGREKLQIILGDQSKDFLRQLDEVYSVMSMRAGVAQQSKTAIRTMAQEAAKDVIQPTMGQLAGERGVLAGPLEALRRKATETPSQQEAFQKLMGEIAVPLTRQGDLTELLKQMQRLRQAAPQLERGRGIYEAGKAAGTYGAIGLTPAMQALLSGR